MFFHLKEHLFKKMNPAQKQIEQQMRDMKLYLENNYKDLAIQARKEAIQLVEKNFSEGKISEASYKDYMQTLETYTKQMAHYNHQEFYRS